MNTRDRAGKEDGDRGGETRGSQGLRGLRQHRGQRPASHPGAGPTDRAGLLGHSPVVDLQDGEPRVLRQLFLLLLRGVRVLWPPARVTLPAQLPSDPPRPGPMGMGSPGWGRARRKLV